MTRIPTKHLLSQTARPGPLRLNPRSQLSSPRSPRSARRTWSRSASAPAPPASGTAPRPGPGRSAAPAAAVVVAVALSPWQPSSLAAGHSGKGLVGFPSSYPNSLQGLLSTSRHATNCSPPPDMQRIVPTAIASLHLHQWAFYKRHDLSLGRWEGEGVRGAWMLGGNFGAAGCCWRKRTALRGRLDR